SGTDSTHASRVSFICCSASSRLNPASSPTRRSSDLATTGTIRVTTPGGTATSAGSFTVINPPTITSFTPASGPVGTSVSISGTKITRAYVCTPNTVGARLTVTSATSIHATVPAGATT